MPTAEDKTGVGMLMGYVLPADHLLRPNCFVPSIAKRLVSKRFGEGKEEKQDMLGSFIKHGLSQRQAETEAVFQMSALSLELKDPVVNIPTAWPEPIQPSRLSAPPLSSS